MDNNIKILATADLHLGKSSADITEDHASTKFTLKKITQYCIAEQIDVLLLSGDIIDWDNRFFEAYGPLQEAFDMLGKHNINVYLVAGNHDYNVLPQIINTGNNAHVHLLGKDQKWEVQEFTKNGQTIQFIGWSFANRYVHESAMLTWDASLLNPNYSAIGLLHGDIDNMNSAYNPIHRKDLQNTDIALWVLGHIHKPQQLSNRPQVWYPGSPQALSAKETGPHGFLLINILPDQTPQVAQVLISPVRYEDIEIDISGIRNEEELRSRIIKALEEDKNQIIMDLDQVESLVYHITLIGKSSLAKEITLWKTTVIDYNLRLETGTRVSVRRVDTQIQPEISDLQQIAKQSSPAGILANTILAIEEKRKDVFLDELMEDWIEKMNLSNQVGAYYPLHNERIIENTPENARIALKNECNRLLGELMTQTSKSN